MTYFWSEATFSENPWQCWPVEISPDPQIKLRVKKKKIFLQGVEMVSPLKLKTRVTQLIKLKDFIL